MPWAGPEKREAELVGTPRGTRPSTPPPNDMDGAVDISDGPVPTTALSSEPAPSAAPVVTGPDGAPVMPKLILNACCPSGQRSHPPLFVRSPW
jgi:hypothetical protein